jgi:hypothetical protein
MAILCTTVVLLFYKRAYDAVATRALILILPAGWSLPKLAYLFFDD